MGIEFWTHYNYGNLSGQLICSLRIKGRTLWTIERIISVSANLYGVCTAVRYHSTETSKQGSFSRISMLREVLGVLLTAIQCDLKSMPPISAYYVKLYSKLHQNSDVILLLCHWITALEIKNKNKFSKMCHKRTKSGLPF